MDNFLEKIRLKIQNFNKGEDGKFIFLTSSMVNIPILKIIFDYFIQLINENKANIVFRLDNNVNLALKNIGKTYKTTFDGNNYIFSINKLSIENIIESIAPYIFINFIKNKDELFNLMTLFCQDLFDSTNPTFDKRMMIRLIEEKLQLKLDPHNKGGFILNQNQHNEYLNEFYKKHHVYNKIQEDNEILNNLPENFVKFIFGIFSRCKDFKEKCNYIKYINDLVKSKLAEQHIERFYKEILPDDYGAMSFTYADFIDVFKNFLPNFLDILDRIKQQTSISIQFITTDFKNNYDKYMEQNYMKGIHNIDGKISNNTKIANNIASMFGIDLIKNEEVKKIEE